MPPPILEAVLLTRFPRLNVPDDNFEKALDMEFVAVFTLPPALANCASASVMRMVFSLIFGAFSITLKNFFVSCARFCNCPAVWLVLFPALASLPMDCTNKLVGSETSPTLDSVFITDFNCFPSPGSATSTCFALSPAFTSFCKEETKRLVLEDTSGRSEKLFMEFAILSKVVVSKLSVLTSISLLTALIPWITFEPLKSTVLRTDIECATFCILLIVCCAFEESTFPSFSIAFVTELIFLVSILGTEIFCKPLIDNKPDAKSLSDFPLPSNAEKFTRDMLVSCFVRPPRLGKETLTPFNVFMDADTLPISLA